MAFKIWRDKKDKAPDIYLDLREFGPPGSCGAVVLIARSKEGTELASLIVFEPGRPAWLVGCPKNERPPGLKYTQESKLKIE